MKIFMKKLMMDCERRDKIGSRIMKGIDEQIVKKLLD